MRRILTCLVASWILILGCGVAVGMAAGDQQQEVIIAVGSVVARAG